MKPGDPEHVLAVVQENPMRPGERHLRYMERIAVLAGLMKPEDAAAHDEHGRSWSSTGEVLSESWFDPPGTVAEQERERPEFWWQGGR